MTIHSIFEQIAANSANAIAIGFGDCVMTYGELNRRANRLAQRLVVSGVRPGAFVGLGMERSIDVVVGMLAILKVGAAFVPLDSTYPDDRLRFMTEDTQSRIVVVHQSTRERLASVADSATLLSIDLEDESKEDAFTSWFGSSRDVASVMYTSGSTGKPKGVLVRHSGITRLVKASTFCDFSARQTFLLHSPLTFDASTLEIWGPLLNGGRLVIYPPTIPTLDGLADAINRFEVTTLWLTAGLFHLIVDQRPQALTRIQQLLAGGDVLSPSHVTRALSFLPDSGVLINGYGPTECTTFTCCFPMSKTYQPNGAIPIGWPIGETAVHIFDEQFRTVSKGESGELFVGGAGVAAGYLNRLELTKERFVLNPKDPSSGDILYRTGDRVRELPDGSLEFLGRFDDQVKIAGHRIEPGEIEAALCDLPGVQQAVVVAKPMPSGNKQLIAYLIGSSPHYLADPDSVKSGLSHRLPGYLIPTEIIILDRFPLTPNGKVDRAALLAQESLKRDSFVVDSNASDWEKKLVTLWQSILRREVSLDHNFFDLGGSSLQLLGLHAELSGMAKRPIAITELFEHTTIRTLAARLNQVSQHESTELSIDDRAKRQRDAFQRRRSGKGIER